MSNPLSGPKALTRAVVDAQSWYIDPTVIRKRWSEWEYNLVEHGEGKGKLYFATMWDNAVARPHPLLVDPSLDVPHEPHEFYNYEDEFIFKLYNKDLFKGCPVGLQLIGRRLEEEAVLRMTEIVEDTLGKWKCVHYLDICTMAAWREF
ncbi:hypothetical protein BDQ17DRAFT_1429416 [Cyathus striatus]|nr:hypothetical protein BDQ17DRAFT_1429416 [Cyathus striatus]